jgi:hypothetical protein
MLRAAALLALIAAPLAAQSAFEGSVSMTVTGDNGRSLPMTYQLKDGKMRMEQGASGQQIAIVMDMPAKIMLIVMTTQKMYMEREMPTAADVSAATGGTKTTTVTKTGKTEVVAGYKCEHITISSDDGATDACVTSELGAFMMPGSGSPMGPQRPASGWSASLDRASFPLKVQQGDRVIMEVTNIEKKSLDAALFAAPEGFQKLSMPAGMPGMPGRKPPVH